MDNASLLIIVVLLLTGMGVFALKYYALRKNIESVRQEHARAAEAQLQQWREAATHDAQTQLLQWRDTDLVQLRSEQRELAQQEALVQLEQWKATQEQIIRVDAIQRSQAVIMGKVTEHFIPYLPDFAFNPKDARFMGSPVDFVIFDGLDEGEIRQVVFIEIKTGKSTLTQRERQIRQAIQSGRVQWLELRSAQHQVALPTTLPLA